MFKQAPSWLASYRSCSDYTPAACRSGKAGTRALAGNASFANLRLGRLRLASHSRDESLAQDGMASRTRDCGKGGLGLGRPERDLQERCKNSGGPAISDPLQKTSRSHLLYSRSSSNRSESRQLAPMLCSAPYFGHTDFLRGPSLLVSTSTGIDCSRFVLSDRRKCSLVFARARPCRVSWVGRYTTAEGM